MSKPENQMTKDDTSQIIRMLVDCGMLLLYRFYMAILSEMKISFSLPLKAKDERRPAVVTIAGNGHRAIPQLRCHPSRVSLPPQSRESASTLDCFCWMVRNLMRLPAHCNGLGPGV